MAMDTIGSQEAQDPQGQVESDPWAAAFAALDKMGQDDAAPAEGGQPGDGTDAGTGDAGAGEPAADALAGDGAGDEAGDGGLGDPAGEAGQPDGGAGEDLLGISEDEIEDYRSVLADDVRDRAIVDIAQEFVKRGIRHQNGRLGATIEDEDICKRDRDGVPRFYNPETGREFIGDNPRRQAQEWVDDYNRELADAFNRACEKYEANLMEAEAPSMAVLEFAPTYEKLDPIRKGMLESVLEDYEIEEDGEVVGYSVDLNRALALVDRQVAMIQGYAKAQAPAQRHDPEPKGPALDMGNAAAAVGSNGGKPKFNSIAEAMEYQQDQLLASLNAGK